MSVCSEYMASKKLSLKSWLASQPCLCIYKFTFFIQFCRALIAAARRGRPLSLEYSRFLGAPLPCLEDLSLSSEYVDLVFNGSLGKVISAVGLPDFNDSLLFFGCFDRTSS